jgi:FKBP-type peptidyl-prolyl cis-trans isomerase
MLMSAPMKFPVLVVAGSLLLAPLACNKKVAEPAATTGGLVVEDIKIGQGAIATQGKTVAVQYTGRLTDGTKFDSSLDAGKPFEFRLGARQVIRGWDMGIDGLRVGGKRKLTIPPELAYGAEGTPGGPIPPNATLVFDVELVAVK